MGMLKGLEREDHMALILGLLNLALVAYLFSLWILKRYTRSKGRNVNTSFKLRVLKLGKYHKPAGMALLLSGILHGYIALGYRFSINHNGFLIWIFAVLAVVLGMFQENSKNGRLRKAHIQYGFLIIVAIVYHLLVPGALWIK